MSTLTNLGDSRSCPKCPEGYYCGSKGMTAVTTDDECDAGFWCLEGALEPDPTDGITGLKCPKGYYCTTGCRTATACPISCPDGYYNPEEMAKSVVSCLECIPGDFCDGTGSEDTSGNCEAGFICPEGSPSTYKTLPSDGITG